MLSKFENEGLAALRQCSATASTMLLQLMLLKFENEGLGALGQCSATASTMLLQLMLSKFENDGKLNPSFKTGPFKLPVAKIWGYPKEPQSPRFVLVSSAGVTRPNRYEGL